MPLNLAGSWSGTWTFVTAGFTVSETVSMTVTQNGETSAGGQWVTTSGAVAGTVAFPPTADFTGTANISQTLLNGVNCSATTTATGTATASQIRFTLGTLTPAGLCQWATNHSFTFTK